MRVRKTGKRKYEKWGCVMRGVCGEVIASFKQVERRKVNRGIEEM